LVMTVLHLSATMEKFLLLVTHWMENSYSENILDGKQNNQMQEKINILSMP
jgi:hypothetical protein